MCTAYQVSGTIFSKFIRSDVHCILLFASPLGVSRVVYNISKNKSVIGWGEESLAHTREVRHTHKTRNEKKTAAIIALLFCFALYTHFTYIHRHPAAIGDGNPQGGIGLGGTRERGQPRHRPS